MAYIIRTIFNYDHLKLFHPTNSPKAKDIPFTMYDKEKQQILTFEKKHV